MQLIAPLPESHGVHEAPALNKREVFCDVQSVTRMEAYEAMSHGHRPEVVLVLSDWAEYQGELRCEFEGRLYNILRTYTRTDHHIELVLERVR